MKTFIKLLSTQSWKELFRSLRRLFWLLVVCDSARIVFFFTRSQDSQTKPTNGILVIILILCPVHTRGEMAGKRMCRLEQPSERQILGGEQLYILTLTLYIISVVLLTLFLHSLCCSSKLSWFQHTGYFFLPILLPIPLEGRGVNEWLHGA